MLVDRGSVGFFWAWIVLAVANLVILFTISTFPPFNLLMFGMACVFAYAHYKAFTEDGRSPIPAKIRRK